MTGKARAYKPSGWGLSSSTLSLRQMTRMLGQLSNTYDRASGSQECYDISAAATRMMSLRQGSTE